MEKVFESYLVRPEIDVASIRVEIVSLVLPPQDSGSSSVFIQNAVSSEAANIDHLELRIDEKMLRKIQEVTLRLREV